MRKTRSNPNEILADLNEALRHKRVAGAIPERPGTEWTGINPTYPYKIDLRVPAFDFGSTVDGVYVFTQAGLDAGWEMLMRGELCLPFPRCIFIATALADAPAGTLIDIVLLLDQTDENEVTVTIFDQEWGVAPLRFRLPGGQISTWLGHTLSVQLTPGNFAMLTPMEHYAYTKGRTEADREQDLKWASNITDIVMSGLAALALRGTESREAPSTPTSEAVNRGRLHGKLLPLPLVRTIHIERAAWHAHTHGSGSGSGSPVRPHLRRGHYRTLADGRRVPVREARIHGGPVDASPPIYEVTK